MKLKDDNSVLNFGDTSFRRKSYLLEYRSLLNILRDHMKTHAHWKKDVESQKYYYESVLDRTNLFERNETSDDKLAKRGRTLTNSLVKTGLITESRKITNIGENWLNQSVLPNDKFEKVFGLNTDNLVFYRQWLKFKLFDKKGKYFFSPFIFTLRFLSKYKDVPINDFLTILHSITPLYTQEEINNIVNEYQRVIDGELIFDKFADLYLDQININDIRKDVDSVLSEKTIVLDKFNKIFKNGKSQNSAGPKYLKFVNDLISFKNDPSENTLSKLLNSSKIDKIRKAFGFGKIPFNISSRRDYDYKKFQNDNASNYLLNNDNFLIYVQFKKSKRFDLVKEYGDMTRRLLSLTGLIQFEGGLVNCPFKEVFSELFNQKPIDCIGISDYKFYEQNNNSPFFNDISTIQILNLENDFVDKLMLTVSKRFDINDISLLPRKFEADKDKRFINLIRKKFDRDTVISILNNIKCRNDTEVKKEVTDSTDVPTIFEYILGISWYYLSNGNINVRKSLNLTLDGDLLPLSHAAGNQGDIELEYPDKKVLLEATLMDSSTQKRGELEPVIRHTTNLAVENSCPVQSIFFANEIDNNVSNIFRAMSYVQLHHSRKNYRSVSGINIFSFTIEELSKMISKNITDKKILKTINDNFKKNPRFIYSNWRDTVVKGIFL
ncbi:AlwI family type II restriction endonuclease [Oenococcus oeni]|uniref:AlwI family type II restriction endonuclease n=2 Tax=Oenococcus oeni TaxID=1247 RepID=UPI000277B855|nr:AlwI family type II restriction endonuclease [Oenococcus oeni]EJO02648.1 type Is restriction endonuclease [Oenococcus oeni AWRIB418]TEU23242.1 AlwI family type II restriction endonuclease [Oenococcus oeni]TEU52928.1 AlwI family type II restriction endonuclease [Oenococcus oeni]TEU62148.1 AlwI family type II restriction endonuclease [Oenococcus oeni]USO98825.1 AlwI family type II restriction endonuclease [Oenococcus oeni]